MASTEASIKVFDEPYTSSLQPFSGQLDGQHAESVRTLRKSDPTAKDSPYSEMRRCFNHLHECLSFHNFGAHVRPGAPVKKKTNVG